MASAFTLGFVVALLLSFSVRVWLAARQIRHVRAHREATPAAFANRIDGAAHRKAADYTIAKQRLGMLEIAVDTVVLVALTLGGGIAFLVDVTQSLSVGPLLRDLLLLIAVALIGGVIALPFSW